MEKSLKCATQSKEYLSQFNFNDVQKYKTLSSVFTLFQMIEPRGHSRSSFANGGKANINMLWEKIVLNINNMTPCYIHQENTSAKAFDPAFFINIPNTYKHSIYL